MGYSINRILVTLWLLAGLGWTACVSASTERESAAPISQVQTDAIESKCIDGLLLLEEARQPTTYAVSGGMVNVNGYCKAYARGQVFSVTYPVSGGTVDLTDLYQQTVPPTIDTEPESH
ncbi:MAG: hypothetical protein O7B25_00115 [Gammaproteobacteria bacterium]|nr:hypothetical protein [Gammaproteobacteria bacterium]